MFAKKCIRRWYYWWCCTHIGYQRYQFQKIGDLLQTDAVANPGFSCGDLVNADGLLMGVMSGIFMKNIFTSLGINFAIDLAFLFRLRAKFSETTKIIKGVLA